MLGAQRERVVLVVEDDPLIRALIATEFSAHGWQVLEACKGEDAIDWISEHSVDVLFTDIQLAGQLSGWDVAEALRAARSELPVIYTSGNAADRNRQVAGSLFFEKPYDPSVVVSAGTKLLDTGS